MLLIIRQRCLCYLPKNITGAVRRFFYVDGTLGTSQGSTPTAADFQVVQFPSKFRLAITQRPDPSNEIFPPQIFIT